MLMRSICHKLLTSEWHLYKINSLNRRLQRLKVRHLSSVSSGQQLVVKSYGDPVKVVDIESVPVPELKTDKDILVKFEGSPINPADINTIQGVYGIKPDFPFIPGNEGVMTVLAAGKSVTGLKEGDKAIPFLNALGTWRTHALLQEHQLIKIPSHIDIAMASTIGVNPCTAFRMLEDFVPLQKGDVVIQNCANSAVGQAVIQIAAAKGIQTVNIVRDRQNLDSLKSFLHSLGATLVITDTELRSSKEVSEIPKPKLALNGVSGKPATEMLRKLDNGGTMVTYGGMSKQPVIIPVGSLIFNDLIFRGFWMTLWNKVNANNDRRQRMLKELFSMVDEGSFRAPSHTLVPLTDFKLALNSAMPSDGKIGKKQILTFN